MRHTVIGLFDTYTQAECARDTLVQTGFAIDAIELQSNPQPASGSAADETGGTGLLANLERFLSNLFAAGPRAADTQRYTDAVRRGAVLVCIDAASESHAELARNTLMRLGATEVGERARGWDTEADGADDLDAGREHSVLDELGIGAMTHVPNALRHATTHSADPHRADDAPKAAEPRWEEPLQAHPSMPGGETARTAPSATAAGGVPGSGAVLPPSETVSGTGNPTAGAGAQTPDEDLEYEENFRSHFDEQYSSEGLRYEDYVPAYRYGAAMARDVRYRDLPWDDIEPDAQRDWETTSPESTWERVKIAVRHGWERVTGHHHHV